MSDRSSLVRHWPLLLATVFLSAAFAAVFLVSVDRVKTARSAELSLEMGRAPTAPAQGLTYTTRLGTLPPRAPSTRKPVQPAPWWPALLFGLAFLCGWLYRNTVRRPAGVAAPLVEVEQDDSLQTPVDSSDFEYAFKPGSQSAENEDAAPDLAVDFPWDDSALDDHSHLSKEEHIQWLETQNAAKVEIIKALEKLIAENREKWLHQDETEARLDKHIRELTDDLQLAVRQLQQLQADSPLPESKASNA